jgi:hypothetical protein
MAWWLARPRAAGSSLLIFSGAPKRIITIVGGVPKHDDPGGSKPHANLAAAVTAGDGGQEPKSPATGNGENGGSRRID